MFDFAFLVWTFLCIYILMYIFYEVKGPYNFPPGPWRLPFVGNSILLKRLAKRHCGFHKALNYLSHQYNKDIIGLKLGSDNFVIVFSKDLIKQVLTEDEFQARPDNFFMRLRTMGTRKGIVMTDGTFWQEQRNFAFRHLRNLGFGKSHMETLIIDELQDLIALINSEGGSVKLSNQLPRCVLNVLWALTAGNRFASGDTKLATLLNLMEQRSGAFDMAGGILSQLPFLSYIAPEWSGYNIICSLNMKLKDFLEKSIAEHKETIQPGETRDFIDAYLHEIEASKGQETTFSEEQLIMICLDFFIAGSQTSSNTLGFAFLNMVIHQDVQEKVYQEIRYVLGNRKLPSLEDRSSLPYVEAVLLESQRLLYVLPVVGPRRVLWDTTLAGYNIPKGTTVLTSMNTMHHDETVWEQPKRFWPERFLDEKNKNLVHDLFLFGVGKRRCPGEALAKNLVFLFFIGMLRNFHLDVQPESEKPTLDPIPGISIAPRPYKYQLTQRND